MIFRNYTIIVNAENKNVLNFYIVLYFIQHNLTMTILKYPL